MRKTKRENELKRARERDRYIIVAKAVDFSRNVSVKGRKVLPHDERSYHKRSFIDFLPHPV